MGVLQTNPPTLPNTVSDSWQPLVERDALGYAGMNKVTLTNWDETTTIPQLAQGSIIDIDGSLATFATDEAIGGTPVDGTVYLKFVVSGLTVTPEFTAEFPTWYADKAGWYNVAGERFSGHRTTKAGAIYTLKTQLRDNDNGTRELFGPQYEIECDDISSKSIKLSDGGIITYYTDHQGASGTTSVVFPPGIASGYLWIFGSGTAVVEVQDSIGTWRIVASNTSFTVISDGVHYRYRLVGTSSAAGDIAYTVSA